MRRAVSRDLFDDANEAIHQSVGRISHSGNSLITMVMEQIRDAVCKLWPRKTATNLSASSDLTDTQAYRVLSGDQGFSGSVLIHLLRSENGFQILEAIMKGSAPQWWREVGHERQLTEIKKEERRLAQRKRLIEGDVP